MISIVFTELRPSFTFVRTASPFGSSLNIADRAVLLAERRPADVDDVVQLLELDRAVDAQVRPRAGGQRAIQDDVHADGAAGDAGSMRATLPLTMPLRVSTSAAFVLVRGEVTLDGDVEALLPWATRIGGRYMGKDRAEEFGRRNAVPEELLVRLVPTAVVAQAGIAD